MSTHRQSFFLVLEGMDGSGKTALSRQLKRVLQQTHGGNIRLTFEPHDPSSAGLYIRQVLSKQIRQVPPETLALAFALNRADHNDRVLSPFLDTQRDGDTDGRLMICDRYYLSSLVYQATGSLSMDDVMWLNRHARRPDLTLFLNVSPHNAYARMRHRPQDKELFEKNLSDTRQQYGAAIAYLRQRGDTVLEVDANPDFNTVLNSVLDILLEQGPDWLRVQRPLLLPEVPEVQLPDAETVTARLSAHIAHYQDDASESDLRARIRDDLQTTPYETLTALFIGYLQAMGYRVGRSLTWTEAPAWQVTITLPGGIDLAGTALLMGEAQRYDAITRVIQAVLAGASDRTLPEGETVRRLSDFMFVLDATPYRDLHRTYQRGGSDTANPVSPAVRIIGRDDLADFIWRRVTGQTTG